MRIRISKERTCRRCGCTDSRACAPAGCAWLCATIDICSKCVRPEEVDLFREAVRIEHVLDGVAELINRVNWAITRSRVRTLPGGDK
jgi:hypothetical protein